MAKRYRKKRIMKQENGRVKAIWAGIPGWFKVIATIVTASVVMLWKAYAIPSIDDRISQRLFDMQLNDRLIKIESASATTKDDVSAIKIKLESLDSYLRGKGIR